MTAVGTHIPRGAFARAEGEQLAARMQGVGTASVEAAGALLAMATGLRDVLAGTYTHTFVPPGPDDPPVEQLPYTVTLGDMMGPLDA